MGDEPIAMQIVRLLDAINNRYDPLRIDEPLIAACDARYEQLKREKQDFVVANRTSRAEAVTALMERGGNLPAPRRISR